MWNDGLDEAKAGINTSRRNNSNLRSADDTTNSWKQRRAKESLDEGERGEKKICLKANIKKTKTIAFCPFIANMEKKLKQWQIFSFGAPKSLQFVIAGMKLEDTCYLEGKQRQT